MHQQMHIGLPRMHQEPGERRDFLPPFIGRLLKRGARVILEKGYGSGMGLSADEYLQAAPAVEFGTREECYEQDYVLVLRYPLDQEIGRMRRGACLLSMLHLPTRPQRADMLRARSLEAVSFDLIRDDTGRRLIENLRAVAWNGVEMAFRTLRRTFPAPGLESPGRKAIQVTLLGAGAVGGMVVRAAIRYGDDELRARLAATGIPGVRVTVVDHDFTPHEELMRGVLAGTDLLIDATQRVDPTRVVIPNEWLGDLPQHAVVLDLSVDPYNFSSDPPHVKGIEGIPQGNLDRQVFPPDDPVYDSFSGTVSTHHRRHVVSCYSWPGLYPQACMQVYGRQLQPILRVLIEKGGIGNIDPNGRYFERAITRAQLSRWTPGGDGPLRPEQGGLVAGGGDIPGTGRT